ncbi:hypothetical protein ACFFX0_28615 [Citricoccus parietis]|uniref:DUF2752 domain-containing protein n=1 Tax=Citricoccus parietis TaxID=592307 RepID=A0ABV5G7L0_9MICC
MPPCSFFAHREVSVTLWALPRCLRLGIFRRPPCPSCGRARRAGWSGAGGSTRTEHR